MITIIDQMTEIYCFETTFRLIAELGFPLRCGEDPPATEWVLAGLPWSDAETAWRELVRQNTEGRPVALLNPFGGAEPLKGCGGSIQSSSPGCQHLDRRRRHQRQG